MNRTVWLAALLIGCGNDDATDTDTGDAPSCANNILGQNPEDGTADAYHRSSIDFLLAQADDSAVITVSDSAGAPVDGSSALEGRRVVFTPTSPLNFGSDYTVQLDWECDPVTASFSTSNVGDTAVDAAGLVGRTWGFALTDGRIVDPPELEAVLPMMIQFDILVMVESLDGDNLKFIGAVTDEAGAQSQCAPHITFPDAGDYSANPYFQVEADEMSLVVAGDPLQVTDLVLNGTFSGDQIESVYLSGLVNLGSDLCSLMSSSGVQCVTCPDGSGAFCVDLVVDNMTGTERDLTVVEWTEADYPASCDDPA